MTTVSGELAIRLAAFASVFGVMAAWEIIRPARSLRLSRLSRWRTNLGLAFLNALVLRFILPTTTIAIASVAAENNWGLLHRMELPGVVEVALGVVLLDLVIYFQHVVFHAVPALTRLHAVHHADLDFDLTTGLRFHPVEILISTVIKVAAVVALGAPILAVLIFEVLLNVTAIFNHSNVAFSPRVDASLRRLLVTPDMHRIHHSVVEGERNSNYGFCLSIWDRLLGTYTPRARGDLDIGLQDWRDPGVVASLSGTLAMPFSRETGHGAKAANNEGPV